MDDIALSQIPVMESHTLPPSQEAHSQNQLAWYILDRAFLVRPLLYQTMKLLRASDGGCVVNVTCLHANWEQMPPYPQHEKEDEKTRNKRRVSIWGLHHCGCPEEINSRGLPAGMSAHSPPWLKSKQVPWLSSVTLSIKGMLVGVRNQGLKNKLPHQQPCLCEGKLKTSLSPKP